MKNNPKLLLAAIGLALSFGAANAAQAACLSPNEIQQATAEGRILPLDAIARRAGVGPGTNIKLLGFSVCERGGGLYYDLSVLGKNGRAGKRAVDAASGAVLN